MMIKERIIQLIEYKGIAKELFFNKIGMTSANFRGNAKKTPLNSDAIENILSEIADINPEWLLTGKGNMLKSDIKKESSCESVESLKELLKAKEEIIELQRKLINSLENKNATNSGSVKVNSLELAKEAKG